jgi:hypothetical protein
MMSSDAMSHPRKAARMKPNRPGPWWRSRWWMPSFALLLGALVLAAMAAGGNTADGLKGFGTMAAVAALFYFGGRSDTLRGFGGPGRDERWSKIDLRASAFAGLVIITVLAGAWLIELSQGQDGSPYSQAASTARPTASSFASRV